mgnify:CR=1 FL=1
MVYRVGFLRWRWSVCIGGATWSTPQEARTKYVRRRAARHISSTPNRAARRALEKLNPDEGDRRGR